MKDKKLPTLSDSDIVTTNESVSLMQSSKKHLSTIAIALALTTGSTALSCRAIRSDYSDCDGDYSSYSDFSDSYDSTSYADSKPCD